MIVNKCGCGREYTFEAWQELPYLGVTEMPDDGKEPTCYEYRDCPCGSTLAIGLDKNGNFYPEKATK